MTNHLVNGLSKLIVENGHKVKIYKDYLREGYKEEGLFILCSGKTKTNLLRSGSNFPMDIVFDLEIYYYYGDLELDSNRSFNSTLNDVTDLLILDLREIKITDKSTKDVYEFKNIGSVEVVNDTGFSIIKTSYKTSVMCIVEEFEKIAKIDVEVSVV